MKKLTTSLFLILILLAANSVYADSTVASKHDHRYQVVTEVYQDGTISKTHSNGNSATPEYAPDEVIFKLVSSVVEQGVQPLQAKQLMQQRLHKVIQRHRFVKTTAVFKNHKKENLRRIYRARLATGVSVGQAIQQLRTDPAVEWAEPKYIAHIEAGFALIMRKGPIED